MAIVALIFFAYIVYLDARAWQKTDGNLYQEVFRSSPFLKSKTE